jgi:hypothetical protein
MSKNASILYGRDAALRRPVGAAAPKAGSSCEVLTCRPYLTCASKTVALQ